MIISVSLVNTGHQGSIVYLFATTRVRVWDRTHLRNCAIRICLSVLHSMMMLLSAIRRGMVCRQRYLFCFLLWSQLISSAKSWNFELLSWFLSILIIFDCRCCNSRKRENTIPWIQYWFMRVDLNHDSVWL